MLDKIKHLIKREFDGKNMRVRVCEYDLAECVACEFGNVLVNYLRAVTNVKVVMVNYDGEERVSIFNDSYYNVLIELEVDELSVKVMQLSS